MAFLRNYPSETVSQSIHDDMSQVLGISRVHSLVGNDYLDRSSSEKEFGLNSQYQCDVEPIDPGGFQDEVDAGDTHSGIRISNMMQPSERKTALVGKWGSNFWKDCQPMCPQIGSKSDLYLENGFNARNINGSVDKESDDHEDGLVSEDDIIHKEDCKVHPGQTNVSADEMLSDDYYEQDGYDQNGVLHRSGLSNSLTATSRPPTRPTILMNVKRKSQKASHSLAYVISDDDVDDEDDDYDEGDEDDPDDLDFEPDYGGVGGNAGKQGNDWDGEESDEDDDSFDDLEILEDDDVSYMRKSNDRRRVNSGRTVKSSKEHKPLFASRRKKGRASFDGEDMLAKDSDYDSDQGFTGLASRGVQSQGNNGLRSSALANASCWNSEVRTSSRSLRKVSYVESDESEDHDEIKKKIFHKEEFEEEDGDSIEKVLWHQPKGMAEDALQQNKPANPVLLRQLFDTEPDWNEMEFFIKWKGQSHLHCQWKSFYDLQNLSGFKKVLNYTKKVIDDMKYRHLVSREEIEVIDVSKEMDLDLIRQNCQVERIIADRINKECLGDVAPEYLVKWQGLSYAEATWEKDVDITFAQDAIDEYKAREAAGTTQGKMVDFQRRKSKVSLRKLDEQPMWLKAGQLRDYQLDGLNFLVNSWRNDTNVILADEMGLGKTVQAVSMLGFLQNAQQIHGPFLVVVPLSTLSNWAKEFRKWLPQMNVIIYVGTRSSREVCQQFEFYTNKQTGRTIKFDALLTTYEVVLKDKAVLSKIRWNYLMVDEAHRLKNSEAQLYTALLEFSTKNKLLITGTPLQNSVEELWALLHFLDHEKFKSKDDFVRNYKNLSSVNENQLANLHMELRPHILRRVIKDVEKSLPPKIERILRVEMSPLQKQYYKWILERNFRDLNKGVRGNQVSLLNIVVELKKCCNHPFLFESADCGYGGNSNTIASSKLERLILSSGKLVILDKLLVRLRTTNHRVLIFSQMVRMLDILADYMSLRGFQYQRLDGSTKAELRQQAMDHFNLDGSDDFCFLLSTRAGGLGINLATADTVIIFDSDWNPQNDLQAMSRAHRIGQREVVNIYRFVTSKSVEEDILERAKRKMVLDHLVIQKLNAEGRLEKKEAKKGSFFDKNELSAILRFGAEDLFKEEKNDEESKKKLLSMDIDEILERAEKVEEKDAGQEEGNELLNAFKVANFSSVEDDGGFWSRLIKSDVISQADEALVPRAARNTKSYVETTQVDTTQVDRGSKRKKMSFEPLEKFQKRRKTEFTVHSAPMVDGAIAQVRMWSYGNLSKRDALRFVRAAKKIGNSTQIGLIVSEVGGAVESAPREAQVELFDILVEGCKEAIEGFSVESKGPLLDFFGVPVKANDLLTRIHELQVLGKRINRYKDPFAQYRVLVYLKPSNWSKGCGWNQIDDARLLLGIYFHGFGNWEKMRLDERLGLTKKIAPVELQHHETFLPRAPNLNERASALLEMECAAVTGNTSNVKSSRRGQKKREIPSNNNTSNSICVRDNSVKAGCSRANVEMKRERQQRIRKGAEPLAKEEGELSDTGELYEQFKEVKWMEWCEDVMGDEIKTLNRLHRLQTTSADLPKEKVLARIRKYLQHLGQRIDEIIVDHLDEPYKQHRMAMRLWKYVSTFSNLSGEGLQQIYSKLKLEQGDGELFERPRGYKNGTSFQNKTEDNGKFEAWKRRRRADSQTPYERQQHLSINHSGESNTLGILGCAPSGRCFGNERQFRAPH